MSGYPVGSLPEPELMPAHDQVVTSCRGRLVYPGSRGDKGRHGCTAATLSQRMILAHCSAAQVPLHATDMWWRWTKVHAIEHVSGGGTRHAIEHVSGGGIKVCY